MDVSAPIVTRHVVPGGGVVCPYTVFVARSRRGHRIPGDARHPFPERTDGALLVCPSLPPALTAAASSSLGSRAPGSEPRRVVDDASFCKTCVVLPPMKSTVNITTNSVDESIARPGSPNVAAAFIASAYATAPLKPQYHRHICVFWLSRPYSSVGRKVAFSKYDPGRRWRLCR